jgi:hypothetical protein
MDDELPTLKRFPPDIIDGVVARDAPIASYLSLIVPLGSGSGGGFFAAPHATPQAARSSAALKAALLNFFIEHPFIVDTHYDRLRLQVHYYIGKLPGGVMQIIVVRRRRCI